MLIGYARVSTDDQSLDLERDALGEVGCERIFEDTAGGAGERPALRDAMDHLRAGDTLVVWRLDRLGRSLKDLIAKADTLRWGIGLKSLKEAIDTDSSTGQLVFHIFGALAEFERAVIRERTKAGLASARAAAGWAVAARRWTKNSAAARWRCTDRGSTRSRRSASWWGYRSRRSTRTSRRCRRRKAEPGPGYHYRKAVAWGDRVREVMARNRPAVSRASVADDAQAPLTLAPSEPRSLALSGSVDQHGVWSLYSSAPSTQPARNDVPGEFTLTLHDDSGVELYRQSLTAEDVSHGTTRVWAVRVPIQTRAVHAARIRDSGGGLLLDVAVDLPGHDRDAPQLLR